MQNIIYSSQIPLDWDALSAFKVKNYYTEKEEHFVFCYLKQYVLNGQLKLCCYCFDSLASQKKDLELYLNFNPEKSSDYFKLCFGIDGVESFDFVSPDSDYKAAKSKSLDFYDIQYRTFKANDQQGFYWCAQITIDQTLILDYFDTQIDEKSIVLLNLYKTFPNSTDHACLFPDCKNDIIKTRELMQDFVVLKY